MPSLERMRGLNRSFEINRFTTEEERKQKPLQIVGCELELGINKAIPLYKLKGLGFGSDGSVYVPSCITKEVRTPPFDLKNPSHIKTISTWLDILNESGTINKTCGYHIHINFPKKVQSSYNIKKIMLGYLKTEDFWLGLVSKSRSRSTYCMKLSTCYNAEKIRNFHSLKGLMGYYYDRKYKKTSEIIHNTNWGKRYYFLNLHSIFQRGTIEIRLHQGTLDKDKILNWTKIHYNFMKWLTRITINLDDVEKLNNDKLIKIITRGDKKLKPYIIERQTKFGSIQPNIIEQPDPVEVPLQRINEGRIITNDGAGTTIYSQPETRGEDE